MIVDRAIDFQPGELRCPRCFGKDIMPSMPRGPLDSAMGVVGRIPRRCRFCGKRFYVRAEDLAKYVTGLSGELR